MAWQWTWRAGGSWGGAWGGAWGGSWGGRGAVATACVAVAAAGLRAQAADGGPGMRDPAFARVALVVLTADRLAERCAAGRGATADERAALAAWTAAHGVDAVRARLSALARDPAERAGVAQARSAVAANAPLARAEPCAALAALTRTPDAQLARTAPGVLAALAGAPSAGPEPPSPAPPAGSAPAARLAGVEGFGFDARTIMGVGGFLTTEVYPVVLFRDGSALTDVRGLVAPGGPAADRAAHPARWTRWRRAGDRLELARRDGAWKALPFRTLHRALPDDFRLDGYFRALAGTGNVALGGGDAVTAWRTYRFWPDGRVARDGGAGAQAAAGDAAVTTAGTAPGRRGRYRVQGLEIRIRWDDGREERRVLVADPDDPRTGGIWLDGEPYARRTPP